MEGAVMRDQRKRSEIWLTALLPRFEKIPSHQEFVTGKKDNRSEIVKFTAAWDKIDAALNAANRGSAKQNKA